MSNHLLEFVHPIEEEQLSNFVRDHPFFLWMPENAEHFSEIHFDAIASYIMELGIQSSRYCKTFCGVLSESQQAKFEKSLENVRPSKNYPTSLFLNLGYDNYHGDLVSEILDAVEFRKLEGRGFTKYKNGYKFDAYQFGTQVLNSIDLIQDKNSDKYAYSKGIYHRLADNEFKQILGNFLHEQKTVRWRKSYQNEYLDVMTNIIPISENTLNPPKKISLQNGYYDLESQKFQRHNKNVFFFSQLGFKYDANAKCPKFKRFLSEIFDSDQERIQLIQEILGYILWDEMHAHKYFVFLGNGANGKSVLARIMTLLYGEQHISSTPLKKLETSFGLQDLAGKWLNLAAENEQSHEINSEVLKGLATGDPLLINKKYKDPSTQVLRTKLVLIMNNMFRTLDKTEGFYRRLIIVPFEAIFVEYSGGAKCDNTLYRDPELFEKIAPEISGIFNFALQGLERLRSNDWNFTLSKKCEAAKKQYRADTSPEEAFFESNLEYQYGHSIGKAEVTNRYRDWIATNDIDNGVTARNINKKLDAYAAVKNWSIERYKNNTDRIRNLKWKDDSNGYNG